MILQLNRQRRGKLGTTFEQDGDFLVFCDVGKRKISRRSAAKAQNLPPFDQTLFDRWLELFAETAYELHNDQTALHYIEKATRIAGSLKIGLYYVPAQNADETTA